MRSQDLKVSAFVALTIVLSVGIGCYVGKSQSPVKTVKPIAAVIGATLSPISSKDLRGQTVIISFSSVPTPTVIYVLNPDCYWCARNKNNIETLAAKRKQDFHFIGLSLESPRLDDYVESNDVEFPVYTIHSYDDVHGLTLGSTPQTIVVATDSKVVANWIGAYIGKDSQQIENYFGLRLPGLISDSAAKLIVSNP
jgi:hypothetical protein